MNVRALPTPWRLGYRPALDGLRGLAVLLVVAFHANVSGFGGGGRVGVLMFFVLSGFLITALLVEEHHREGRIDLLAFYRRRAARLLPALLLMLIVVGTAAAAVGFPITVPVLATALYVANWMGRLGVEMGPLEHAWTLGTEEQFYLVWPLLLGGLLVGPSRVRIAVAGAGIGLALWAMPTSAGALLIGCAVALLATTGRLPELRAWAAIPALLVIEGTTLVPHLAWYPWRDWTAAAATGLLITVVAQHDLRYLAWSPLRALGRISYGLYLWHLPMLWFGLPTPLAIALTLAVAVASYRWLELPILRWARRRGTGTPGSSARSRTRHVPRWACHRRWN